MKGWQAAWIATAIAVATLWSSPNYASTINDLRQDGLQLIRMETCHELWNRKTNEYISNNNFATIPFMDSLTVLSRKDDHLITFPMVHQSDLFLCGIYLVPKYNELQPKFSSDIRIEVVKQSYPAFNAAARAYLKASEAPSPDWDQVRQQWAATATDYARLLIATAEQFSRNSADAEKLLSTSVPQFEDTSEKLRQQIDSGIAPNVARAVIEALKTLDEFIATVTFR